MSPVLSVLLPVWNAARFLPACLASLESQTLPDFEVIAVDDGSDDSSGEILEAHQTRLPMQVIRTTHRGFPDALNVGLEVARGELLARQDADDISEPERLAMQVRQMADDPDLAVLGTGFMVIDESGDVLQKRSSGWPTKPEDVYRVMRWACCVLDGSAMIRREALAAVSGYRTEFRYAADYDLWLRMIDSFRIGNLRDRLYRYRMHQSSMWGSGWDEGELYPRVARQCYTERQQHGADQITLKGTAGLGNLLRQCRSEASNDRPSPGDSPRTAVSWGRGL